MIDTGNARRREEALTVAAGMLEHYERLAFALKDPMANRGDVADFMENIVDAKQAYLERDHFGQDAVFDGCRAAKGLVDMLVEL